MSAQTISSFELAVLAANMAEDKKAKDTTVLKTDQVSTLTDYFVISTVESRAQMISLADHLIKALKKMDLQPIGQELDQGGRWTLLDFGDVVIHLFHHDDRSFYKLERFWSHATEIPQNLWLKEKRQAS